MRKLYLQLFAFFIFAFSSFGSMAQTILAPGDVAFIGFNTALLYREGFTFVCFVPITSGTVIKFTDDGFNSTSPSTAVGNLRQSEQVITWTASANLSAGTEITIDGDGVSTNLLTSNHGTVSTVDGANGVTPSMALNVGGDNIFIFQGNSPGGTAQTATGTFPGTLLYGISWEGTGTLTTWRTTGTTSSQSTYLPAEIASYSMYFTGNTAGGEYNGPRTGLTVAQYKADILNAANWNLTINPNGITAYNTAPLVFATAPSIVGSPSNSNICAGSTTTFTVMANNATGYKWQVNTGSGFVDLSNGGVYSGVTTATLTITGATSGMNTYQYQCVASGTVTPNATSSAATLTITSPGQWLGSTSSAWSNTANWGCGVLPTLSTNVTISNTAPHMPVVDLVNAVCNNITIGTGASLTMSSITCQISINGALTINGTLSITLGTVQFPGGAQNIPSATFNNLIIGGTGTTNLTGSVIVNGNLYIDKSLNLGNNNLTISSTGAILGTPSLSNYIIISGTGSLIQQNIGTSGRTGNILFPIGTSSFYNPVILRNTGTADTYKASVTDDIYTAYNASDVATGTAISSNNVNKTWLVSEGTAGGSNVTLTFQWTGAEEQPGFDRTIASVAHYYSGAWHAAPRVAASGSTNFTTSLSGITSFSPFAVSSGGTVLPLDLLSFTGKEDPAGNVLAWTSANEINVASYIVERSSDAVHFTSVGIVTATGNSIAQQQYQFTDAKNITSPIGYYRLKMTDDDGSFKYSNIVNIINRSGVTGNYSIFPNPVVGSDLSITTQNVAVNKVLINITDVSGKVWYAGSLDAGVLNSGKATIGVGVLSKGTYFLRISDEKTTATSVLKFEK
jgi:predicted secreted protein